MPQLHARHRRVVSFRHETRTDIAMIVRTASAPAKPLTGAALHKQNLLSLLSVVTDATLGELAYCLELSRPYVMRLLDELNCEGRIRRTARGIYSREGAL